MMNSSPHPFLVTLYNEKHSTVRGLEGGEWGRMLTQSSLAITGFGYFAEGADAGGTSYYNTSVRGKGAEYRDPNSLVFQNEDNFMLLHLRRHPAQLRAST